MGKVTKQTVPQRSIQMFNKLMKRCSTSLIIQDMQIKTTMRYDFIPTRMAFIEKTNNNGFW